MWWKFWAWPIWHQPQYTESGKDALAYLQAELAKQQGPLTEESEDQLIRQVQRQFQLGEATAANLVNTALFLQEETR